MCSFRLRMTARVPRPAHGSHHMLSAGTPPPKLAQSGLAENTGEPGMESSSNAADDEEEIPLTPDEQEILNIILQTPAKA
jgi:hypothetical protein